MVRGRKKVRLTNSEFLKRVEQAVGGEYTFLEKYKTAKTKILVKHNVCGFEYKVTPDKFTNRGQRCPKCQGKYQRTAEEFSLEVVEISRGEYEVIGRYVNTATNVEFRHNRCGTEYTTSPSHFLMGKRCPKCAGNSIPTDEEFREDIRKLVGDEYTFLGQYHRATTKMEVRHNECRKIFSTTPNNFKSGKRCPNCLFSRGEKSVSEVLDNLGVDYIPEWRIGGVLRADFYLPDYRAVIEYDGAQHYRVVEHWGGEEGFEKRVFRDSVKNHYCEYLGIKLLRIPYWDIDNIDTLVPSFIKEMKEYG